MSRLKYCNVKVTWSRYVAPFLKYKNKPFVTLYVGMGSNHPIALNSILHLPSTHCYTSTSSCIYLLLHLPPLASTSLLHLPPSCIYLLLHLPPSCIYIPLASTSLLHLPPLAPTSSCIYIPLAPTSSCTYLLLHLPPLASTSLLHLPPSCIYLPLASTSSCIYLPLASTSLLHLPPLASTSLLHLLSCQPGVTVILCFVYKVIRDLELIYPLCTNPIHRIGLIHK